jgi:hypothetical protein
VVLLTAKRDDTKVPKKGHSEEQILSAFRQAGSGTRGWPRLFITDCWLAGSGLATCHFFPKQSDRTI